MTRIPRSPFPAVVLLGALVGIAPFVAVGAGVVLVIRHVITSGAIGFVRMSDLLWLAAAAAFAVPAAVASGPGPAMRAGAWVLTAWILLRAFEALRARSLAHRQGGLLDGMSVALAVIVVVAIVRAAGATVDVGGIGSLLVPAFAGDASLAHSALV